MLDMIDFSTVGDNGEEVGSKLVSAFEGVLPITEGGAVIPTPLYIYILSHPDNWRSYTYLSCIVVAASEEDARLINPHGTEEWDDAHWVLPDEVGTLYVQKVGIALEDQVAGTVLMTSSL